MTFYFYDLETSGISPRRDRVMQFAGQRTDTELKPIGEPDNFFIKLSPDILPQPEAILITGITPQKTLAEGKTEAEFLKYFADKIATPDTMIIGFNNIRFDDEFMRFMLWRNFYDAYEWQWKDGCSRWDLLDLVRMTRALRPDGIKWPFASDGKPSNRLGLLTDLNNLQHVNAHDAQSDVAASIDLARLINNKQPKLFDYMLNMRSKNKVAALVSSNEPFIYTSGRYPSEFAHTTAALRIGDHPERTGSAIVYDLRVNPKPFLKMTSEELAKRWSAWGKEAPYFPVKILAYNKSPAVAPLNVLDAGSAERLELNSEKINQHAKLLNKKFSDNLAEALMLMKKSEQAQLVADPLTVDEQLYDGFVGEADKTKMSVVRAAEETDMNKLTLDFDDERLANLLPLYKARNFPASLSSAERKSWDNFRQTKLIGGGAGSALAKYFARLEELASAQGMTGEKKYLLDELRLYGESIAPM